MNELFPDAITIGAKYGPAMEITDQSAADAYFERCVEHCMRFGHSQEVAETIERMNLSYYAGYCDQETRLRVERLFRGTHPIFGSAEIPVTPEEAVLKGIEHGK